VVPAAPLTGRSPRCQRFCTLKAGAIFTRSFCSQAVFLRPFAVRFLLCATSFPLHVICFHVWPFAFILFIYFNRPFFSLFLCSAGLSLCIAFWVSFNDVPARVPVPYFDPGDSPCSVIHRVSSRRVSLCFSSSSFDLFLPLIGSCPRNFVFCPY